MERVTIRLDERVERWARQKAADQGISLSRFVERLLRRLKGEARVNRSESKPSR